MNGSDNSYRTLKSGFLSASQFTSGLDQTITLAVVARGEQISLYVSQQLIMTLQDSTYSKGVIGFVSEEFSTITAVAFDNAKVWA